jgi:pilus assembly protein Flp/PilA
MKRRIKGDNHRARLSKEGGPKSGTRLMRKFALKYLADESGATAIEYALLASGIAITLLGAIASIAGGVNGVMTDVSGNL